jgi:hypothetical protein
MSEFWHKLGCCVVEKPQPVSLPIPTLKQEFITMCCEVETPSLICLMKKHFPYLPLERQVCSHVIKEAL